LSDKPGIERGDLLGRLTPWLKLLRGACRDARGAVVGAFVNGDRAKLALKLGKSFAGLLLGTARAWPKGVQHHERPFARDLAKIERPAEGQKIEPSGAAGDKHDVRFLRRDIPGVVAVAPGIEDHDTGTGLVELVKPAGQGNRQDCLCLWRFGAALPRWTATVVLPAPPFSLNTATTFIADNTTS